jgi:hypothetical protein
MANQNNGERPALKTPFCGDLRSKKFYMLDRIAETAEDFIDASNHCWCYHTQTPVGADGKFVSPERCVAGRVCYRSALSEPKKVEAAK